MSTTLPPMTAAQLEALPDDGFRYDLLRGELHQMSPAGREHGMIAREFCRVLSNFVQSQDLGETYASETGFLLGPETVLAPDVSFVVRDRARKIRGVKGFIPLAPDLVVEVISPSDRYKEVDDKTTAWLEAGTRAVVVLDPRKRQAVVSRPNLEPETILAHQLFEIPDIVPGWSIDLNTIFLLE